MPVGNSLPAKTGHLPGRARKWRNPYPITYRQTLCDHLSSGVSDALFLRSWRRKAEECVLILCIHVVIRESVDSTTSIRG